MPMLDFRTFWFRRVYSAENCESCSVFVRPGGNVSIRSTNKGSFVVDATFQSEGWRACENKKEGVLQQRRSQNAAKV